jgi:hypothetical protein
MPKRERSSTRDNVTREAKTYQTSVWLTNEEAGWIDSQLQRIKRAGWRGVNRSAFIRALIRVAMQRAPDVDGVTSEAALAQRLSLR